MRVQRMLWCGNTVSNDREVCVCREFRVYNREKRDAKMKTRNKSVQRW